MEPVWGDPFKTSNEPRPGVLDKNVLSARHLWITAAPEGFSASKSWEWAPLEHPRYTHGCRCAILGCSAGTATTFGSFPNPCSPQWWWGGDFHSQHQWLLCAHLICTNKTRPINKWVHFFPALQMLQQLCRWALGSWWVPCSKALQVFPTLWGGSFGRASCPLLKNPQVLALLVVCLCFSCPPTRRQRCFMVFREAVGTVWGFEQPASPPEQEVGQGKVTQGCGGVFHLHLPLQELCCDGWHWLLSQLHPLSLPAQTPACLWLIALEKQRQVVLHPSITHSILLSTSWYPKLRQMKENFLKPF